MELFEVLDQIVELLRSRKRVTYRILSRQFGLDETTLDELKEELLFSYPQIRDESGRGLVWAEAATEHSEAPGGAAPSYAQPLDPNAYTPPHLAEKILTSHAALEGERKQVTVLFCDLANSTGLAEQLGPETMHTVLNQFFELALNAVHRYEGTINQFLGDGFMALFGAPIAHEDHARRAVLAGLELRRQLLTHNASPDLPQDVPLSLRMGLNTGIVVVGAIGDNLRMDYTAVGDTTNIAARLEQEAGSNQIVISGATHRLVGGYCTTNALGSFALKGKKEPVEAWEVVASRDARTRLEVEAEQGLTPFVARARELRILHECMIQAQAGQGQVVFLVGDAGIGKSRLLLEFRHQLGETDANWLEGHALSYGQSMTLHPLVELLKRNFRIVEDDSEGAIIAKIEQSVLRLGEDLRPILPYLRLLLAVDPGDANVSTIDPQLRRAEIFEALQRLLLRASEIRPQVLVFEDLHWIDNTTEAFLTTTLDSIATNPILCLFTYRPGYNHPFGDRTYHTRLALPTLSPSDSVTMTQAILDSKQLPEDLETLITLKAEGNPFFIEEVVKSLQEMGAIRLMENQYVLARPIEDIMVPDTIQDILMARIDRLAEAPKQTLQLASVIGREFTYRLLDHLSSLESGLQVALQELKTIEFIYETSLFPESVYSFKHALTQDVAYNSMLDRRRQTLHRLVGQAIEELYADRLAEHYETIAYHFARGQDWIKALDFLLKAADKATQAFACREAIGFYQQALEVVERLGQSVDVETIMDIHQSRARLFIILTDFESSRRESQQLLSLAQQAGNRVHEAGAYAAIGAASIWAHDFNATLEATRQAIEMAEIVDAPAALANAYFVTGLVKHVTGELDQAVTNFNQVITMSRSVRDQFHQAFSLCCIGHIKSWTGSYDEALGYITESLTLSRNHYLLQPLLQVLWVQGLALMSRGDYDDAVDSFEEGIALSEKIGNEIRLYRFVNSLGWIYAECGAFERAIALNQQSAEGARRRGDREITAHAELNLADIFLSQGEFKRAQHLLEGVDRLTNDPTTSEWTKWRYSIRLFAGLGEFWKVRGDVAKAETYADQCQELARRTMSRKYIVRAQLLKGEIALIQNRWDEAARWFEQALPLAQTVGNPTQLWRTHLLWGQLHSALHQPERAQQSYQMASEVIDHLKTHVKHPELSPSLQSSSQFQGVYDLIKSNEKAL